MKAFKILVLLFVLLAILYVGFLHHWIRPYFARRDSIRILAAATTEQELKYASDSYGVFLTFPDHSWLAIRYVDSHAGGIWSVAIARDSGGNWFEGHEHFCAALVGVKIHEMWLQEKEFDNGPEDPQPVDPHSKWIRFVSDSPDLETARQRLTSKYFTLLQLGSS